MPPKGVPTKSPPKASYLAVAQSPGKKRNSSCAMSFKGAIRRVRSKLRACFTQIFTKTAKAARRIVEGAPSEEPKLLASHSRLRAVTVCSVHVLPILASTVLVAMNLKGYFVGSQLPGLSDRSSQALYTLFLQVTAKLLELMVVASLGVIVLDVVRYLLFFDEEGLPLALTGTKTKLNDLTLLASPTFWSGIRGLNSWRKRILVGLLVAVCSLVATFIGPSSALLLIPVVRKEWPGGGTQFWLFGNETSLWPDTLDASSIGGPECLAPTADKIYTETLNNSGCIWYWTLGLGQYARDLHFDTNIFNVTVFDAVAARELQRRPSGDTWALSSMAHIARMAYAIGLAWHTAAVYANKNWSRVSTGQTFIYRERSGTVTKVHSLIPAVRTKCGSHEPVDFNSTDTFKYPVMPLYSSAWATSNSYSRSPELYPNTSVITTRWLRKQTGLGPNFNVTAIEQYPSAFLTVQVPRWGSTTQGTIFTCSVDARWAEGNNVGTNVESTTDVFLQHGEVDSSAALFAYTDMILPVDDGTWRTVDLDISWLEALTPVLNVSANISNHHPSPEPSQMLGWTTLSSIFQQAGYDNSTGDVNDTSDLWEFTEMIVALLVADGMSRTGLVQNSGRINQIGDFDENYFHWILDPRSLVSALLFGGSAIRPPNPEDGPATSLDWTVFIEGYSYAADSNAYYLALTVIFVYMALALTHIGYTIRKRWFSECWKEVQDILVLSYNSPTSELLKNTSAGIEMHATNRLTLKVRVPENTAGGQEKVCLVVGLDAKEVGYHRVEVGKKYC